MKARLTIAAPVLGPVLGLTLGLAAPALAQDELPDSARGAAELADRFEFALMAGDARILPLAEDFRYFENGAELGPWDGMWRTVTALEGTDPAVFPGAAELDYRVQLDGADEVVRVVEIDENMVRGVIAYRLVARDGEITRIDVLPIREEFGGDRGGTITLLQPTLPKTMEGALVEAADPLFGRPVANPPMRAELIAATRAYFEAVGSNSTSGVSFAPDCRRLDNGQRVTGAADADILDPSRPEYRPYALGCAEQIDSGFYSNYRLGAIETFADPARGLAIAFVRLDQPGTVLSFEAPGFGTVTYPGPRGPVPDAETGEQFSGRILTNMITPMSVNGVYLLKFEGGAISRIDAFYRGAPYGWNGWEGAQ